MSKKTIEAEIATIAEEESEDFELLERMRGISRRTRVVTVYTDEEVGEELGGAEKEYNQGLHVGNRRWGVRGELADLAERAKALKATLESDLTYDEDAVAAELEGVKISFASLSKRAAKLEKELDKTSLTFTLRGLPEVVMKSVRREAYKSLGLKAKGGLTPEQTEDLQDEYLALVLSKMVTEWGDAADGRTRTSLSVPLARAQKQFLAPSEWNKIELAIDELQARKAIGDRVTASPDF